MRPTLDQVKVMAEFQGLPIPEEEIREVARSLSALLEAFEEVEKAIGPLMDEVDPIPPVYPRLEL